MREASNTPSIPSINTQLSATVIDRSWAAYLCTLQGHVMEGSGYGTNTEAIVWADYCSRCGARFR